MRELNRDRGSSELEMSFVVDKLFRYLNTISVDVEGGRGQSDRVINMHIRYDLHHPYCTHC